MKNFILILILGSVYATAANCVTVDSKGNRVVVDCSSVESSSHDQVRAQRKAQVQMDSSAYQKELDARIQERLRTMNQTDAQKVQATIDAAKSRTEERKTEFLDQK